MSLLPEYVQMVRRRAAACKDEGLPQPLVAFTGYSRQGKDTAAVPFVQAGYTQVSLGDLIKRHAADMTVLQAIDLWFHCRLTPGFTQSESDALLVSALGVAERRWDVHTQDDATKQNLRPCLEWYGRMHYDFLMGLLFERMPVPAVNTRIMQVQEAEQWVAAGGVICEVVRDSQPRTDYERTTMQEMRESGLVHAVIENHGTVSELHQHVSHMFGLDSNAANAAAHATAAFASAQPPSQRDGGTDG